MTLYRGGNPIIDVRRGATPINEIRRGTDLIWSRTGAGALIRDDFNRDDAATLGADWTSHGPSSDYKLGITNNYARVQIPDGLVGGSFALRTSRMRYNAATAGSDDGFLECRMATRGDGYSLTSLSGFVSQVFARLDDDWSSGIGMQMADGYVWIASMVIGIPLVRTEAVAFQPGQVLRLDFDDDDYALSVNGKQRADWPDGDSIIPQGSDFRSLGIRGDGGKDLLGPRRYSSAFDYVVMG